MSASLQPRVPVATGRSPRSAPPADIGIALWRAGVLAMVFAGWWLASTRSSLVPSPMATGASLVAGFADGSITAAMIESLKAIALGFVLAAAIGIPLGLALGWWRTLGRIVDPFFTAVFAVPRVVLYPVILAAVGVGTEAKVWMALLSALLPITMNAMGGIRAAPPTLIKLGRSLGCGQLGILRLILVPNALPVLMVGIRIGISISFISVIVAELFAATDGLGLLIQSAYGLQQYPRMFAVVLLVTAFAFAINLSLWLVERRIRTSTL